MKKAIAICFILVFVVVFIGAQQQVKYDSRVLYIDLAGSTAASIDERIDFYLSYGYTVASAVVWQDTLIVILQGRK